MIPNPGNINIYTSGNLYVIYFLLLVHSIFLFQESVDYIIYFIYLIDFVFFSFFFSRFCLDFFYKKRHVLILHILYIYFYDYKVDIHLNLLLLAIAMHFCACIPRRVPYFIKVRILYAATKCISLQGEYENVLSKTVVYQSYKNTQSWS